MHTKRTTNPKPITAQFVGNNLPGVVVQIQRWHNHLKVFINNALELDTTIIVAHFIQLAASQINLCKVNLPYLPEYNAGPCVNTEPNLGLHFEKTKESRKQRRPFFISLLVQSYLWISKAIDHYKINKFSVLVCMLMRDTSLKHSVDNIHFNSLDFSSERKVHITHG